MKFTKIPLTACRELQLNAGILASNFVPSSGTLNDEDILGATSGGVSFSAIPNFTDFGEDVDNCPKNILEMKRINGWDIKMSGTFVTTNTARAKSLIGAADIDTTDTTRVTPRNNLVYTDFADIWWIGDYSDDNDEDTGGFIAIYMMNALSTGGFQVKSGDKSKGQFPFEYTAHFSNYAQDTAPFEIYIKAGTGNLS